MRSFPCPIFRSRQVVVVVWLVILTPLILGDVTRASEQNAADEQLRLLKSIEWEVGPCVANLGSVAQIEVPDGYIFTGPEGARRWAELSHNPPADNCLGILVFRSLTILQFSFDPVGYISDDEKDQLNADLLLDAIRSSTEQANQYRRGKGWSELHVVGWEKEPFYDETTHNLAWAILGRDDTNNSVNYFYKLLGRRGVMSVQMIGTPDQCRQSVTTVSGLLQGLRFKEGQKYAEWRQGDQVASYGLSGLIAGGGVVVTAKSGLLSKLGILFAKLWKFLAAAAIGFMAWLKRKAFFGNQSSGAE